MTNTSLQLRIERPIGTAECGYCAWRASHRADSLDEAAEFLRRLVVAHIEEYHAERTSPYVITEERDE